MKDSRYFEVPELNEGEVVISTSFAEKYGIKLGDVITLEEEYENVSYEFKVAYIKDASNILGVFVDIDSYNEIFEFDEESFSGFLSSTPIEDVEEKYIGKTITSEDLLMQANQLEHSIG